MSAFPAPLIPAAIGAAVFLGFLAVVRRTPSPAPVPADAGEGTGIRRSPYRRMLAAAGISSSRDQARFALIHAASTVGGSAGAAWALAGSDATPFAFAIVAVTGGWLGWWLPRSWLQSRRTQRRVEMMTEFPVALDLLQIALEGGMGLHAAWAAVADHLSSSGGGLAQEMRRVELEVGFGTGWGPALAAATDRTGLPEFRSLGSLLEQTERFGTEMAQMIQVTSDSLRHDDVQAIEERAHRASVMLLLPLAGLLLPGSLILMFAPLFTLLTESMDRATP